MAYQRTDLAASMIDGCAAQGLDPVGRSADEGTQFWTEGLDGKPETRRDQATALLALLVGGVTLARAVRDEAFSQEIAAAVRKAATLLIER